MDEAFNYLPGKEVGGAAVWLKGEEGEGDNYKEDTLSANLKRGRKRRGKQLEIHSSFSSPFASGGRNAPKNRGGKRRNKDWIHRSRGGRVHLPQQFLVWLARESDRPFMIALKSPFPPQDIFYEISFSEFFCAKVWRRSR